MDVTCSQCRTKINSDNINVAKDTAYCQRCENLTHLSSLLQSTPDRAFDKRQSIKGVSVSESGRNWSIDVSNRSIMALFLVPFTVVWAGGSLSGIYGTQIANGQFDAQQSLFGLPFLIGSIVLVSVALMSLFGRTHVSSENGKALVFIGIGAIGWYRRFEWRSIDSVVEKDSRQYKHISLEGHKRLNLGWGLSSEKRYYLANFLKTKLKK